RAAAPDRRRRAAPRRVAGRVQKRREVVSGACAKAVDARIRPLDDAGVYSAGAALGARFGAGLAPAAPAASASAAPAAPLSSAVRSRPVRFFTTAGTSLAT